MHTGVTVTNVSAAGVGVDGAEVAGREVGGAEVGVAPLEDPQAESVNMMERSGKKYFFMEVSPYKVWFVSGSIARGKEIARLQTGQRDKQILPTRLRAFCL